MAAVSDATVLQLFKTVFGDLRNLIKDDNELAKRIPFSAKARVGDSYVETIALSQEGGITFSASDSAFSLNPARAGAVIQSTIKPYVSVLASVVPWATISRSAGGGERAFFEATKWIVKSNLASHMKFQEVIRLYGRSPDLLGYQSNFTGNYRGAALVAGSGTIRNSAGVDITFVSGRCVGTGANGIAAGHTAILLGAGSFCAGFYVGMEGTRLEQVDAANNVVAAGSIVSCDVTAGYVVVDFAALAAGPSVPADPLTLRSSVRLAYQGMASGGDSLGVQAILQTRGQLFGIDNTRYSLWQGSITDLEYGSKLSLQVIQNAIAQMTAQSGAEGDMIAYCNPRSWASLSNNDAALRYYDSSYDQKRDEAGWESISYYSQNGRVEIRPHRLLKEQDCFIMKADTWIRSGSSDVSFSVPGMDEKLIFPLQDQAGFCFRSYSDQYLFCHAPSSNIYIRGINDTL
jgi:hypothetical protein